MTLADAETGPHRLDAVVIGATDNLDSQSTSCTFSTALVLAPSKDEAVRPDARPALHRQRSVATVAAATALGLLAVFGTTFVIGYRSAGVASRMLARYQPDSLAATGLLQTQPLVQVAEHALSRVVTVRVVTTAGEAFGTGWVFDTRGDVVTNNHVIDGGSVIRLLDARGRVHIGVVMGRDTREDIALVRSIDGLPGDPLPLSAVEDVPHPEKVVVLSSAKATDHLDRTVETLALLHQSVPIQRDGEAAGPDFIGTPYQDMMVMEGEHIYRGNSGGPVLDAYGRVIGVITLASQSVPQAFAIPIARVADELGSFAARNRSSAGAPDLGVSGLEGGPRDGPRQEPPVRLRSPWSAW